MTLADKLRQRLDARELAEQIGEYDFANSDRLELKFGGDGDNGEDLIAAIEATTAPITEALIALAKDAEAVAEHLLVRNMHAEANTLRQHLARLREVCG